MMPLRFLLCFLISLSTSTALAEGFTRAELQKFIDDAIQAGAGEVVLPPGTHRLDQPLIVRNASRLRLAGLDAEDTFLRPIETAEKPFPLIRIEGTADRVEVAKITLSTAGESFEPVPLIEIQVRPPPADPSAAAGEGKPDAEAIQPAESPILLRVDRCLFVDHRGCGIRVVDSSQVAITAGSFRDLPGGAVQATGSSRQLTIQHNHFIRCGSTALTLDPGTRDAVISANDFHDATSLKLEGSSHRVSDNGGLSTGS